GDRGLRRPRGRRRGAPRGADDRRVDRRAGVRRGRPRHAVRGVQGDRRHAAGAPAAEHPRGHRPLRPGGRRRAVAPGARPARRAGAEVLAVVAELAALAAAVLAACGELLHAPRVRAVARLAFGPSGRPRAWTLLAPFLRVAAAAALAWG